MIKRGQEVVKSVARVFEILEFFETARRPLTAAEVSRQLGYPASSTIGLLKSMSTLGYLAFDCVHFTYQPTLRLPMLGNWIREGGIRQDIQHVMQTVHRDSGESASLCVESDGGMKVLAISASDDIASFSKVSAVGDCAPLFDSVVGLTSLSTQSDQHVLQVAGNLLRRPRYIRPEINISDSLERIQRIRDSGFGRAYDLSAPNVGALAWPVIGGIFYRKVGALSCFVPGADRPEFREFAAGLEPRAGESVLTKQYSSAFFGTSLASTLTAIGVDTLIIAGVSTSGCVRASGVDCCQYGFIPIVVRDAVGDRAPEPHEANLFDLQAKYAEVVDLEVAKAFLANLALAATVS